MRASPSDLSTSQSPHLLTASSLQVRILTYEVGERDTFRPQQATVNVATVLHASEKPKGSFNHTGHLCTYCTEKIDTWREEKSRDLSANTLLFPLSHWTKFIHCEVISPALLGCIIWTLQKSLRKPDPSTWSVGLHPTWMRWEAREFRIQLICLLPWNCAGSPGACCPGRGRQLSGKLGRHRSHVWHRQVEMDRMEGVLRERAQVPSFNKCLPRILYTEMENFPCPQGHTQLGRQT